MCRRQLAETTKLVRQDDDAVVIALDIDPNEDAQAVRDHIDRNDYEGIFAVAPIEMTEMLREQYGTYIITPPLSPKVVVTPDQMSAESLGTGVKSAEELAAILDDAK